VQRNRIDAELSHIRRRDTTVRCRLADNSAYEQELRRHKLGLSPSVDEVKSDAVWRLLLDAAAKEPARQQALRDLVEEVDGREEWTKVIVFAPDGAAFAAAAAALRALRRPVVIGDPADAGSTDAILAFSRPDLRDPEAPRVLLLSFDHSSALNLQLVSHDGAPPPPPTPPPRPRAHFISPRPRVSAQSSSTRRSGATTPTASTPPPTSSRPSGACCASASGATSTCTASSPKGRRGKRPSRSASSSATRPSG
jgi:hypothetical protein